MIQVSQITACDFENLVGVILRTAGSIYIRRSLQMG